MAVLASLLEEDHILVGVGEEEGVAVLVELARRQVALELQICQGVFPYYVQKQSTYPMLRESEKCRGLLVAPCWHAVSWELDAMRNSCYSRIDGDE